MPVLNRKKTLLLGTMSGYGTIGISIIIGLASVPLGLSYFGPVRYGIWLVITSFLSYLGRADFGVGLATLSLMAQAPNSTHQRVILRRSIGILLVASLVFVAFVLSGTYLFPGWVGILGNIPSSLQGEAATATLVIGILVVCQLPTTVFAGAFSGLQQTHWNHAYGALHAIIALGALVATILTDGDLITLALFRGLGGLLVGIVSGVHFWLVHADIRPRVTEQAVGAPSTKLLFTTGARFFLLQIAALVIVNTDNLVIAHYLGPRSVTSYAVTFKLFYMSLSLVGAVTVVLWPLYAQAFGRGDWEWIQRTYNRCISLFTTVGGLVWIGGIVFSEWIIDLWVGPAAYGGLAVAFALGGWVYIGAFGGSSIALINGLIPTTIVVAIGFLDAALNLGISLALVGPMGISGIALGTFIACFAVNTWFGPLYIRHRTEGKVKLTIRPVVVHAIAAVAPCVILAVLVSSYLIGWIRLTLGLAIIAVYAVLSWRLLPLDLRDLLARGTLTRLRVHLGRQRDQQ